MTIRHDEPRNFGTPPSLAEMEAMAYQEFEHIPEELRSRQPTLFTVLRALVELFGADDDPHLDRAPSEVAHVERQGGEQHADREEEGAQGAEQERHVAAVPGHALRPSCAR